MFYLSRINQSFKAKMLLFYAVVWSLLYACTGLIAYQIINNLLEEKMGEQLLAMTRLVAEQLEPKMPVKLQPSFFGKPASFALTARLRSFLKAGVMQDI